MRRTVLNSAVARLIRLEARCRQHRRQPRSEPRSAVVTRRVFLSWRKKDQVAHVMRVLNRADCQVMKHNVKKLFQLWSTYHPEDRVCSVIAHIVAKRTERQGLDEMRRDMVRKNNRTRRNANNRAALDLSETDMTRTNSLLLRAIDPSRLLANLTHFTHETDILQRYRRVADLPPIMCYTTRHIDHVIERCQSATRFPLELLPRAIRERVTRLLVR